MGAGHVPRGGGGPTEQTVHWQGSGGDHRQVEKTRMREHPPVRGWVPWGPRADSQELSTYSGAPCRHHTGQRFIHSRENGAFIVSRAEFVPYCLPKKITMIACLLGL